MFQTAVGRIDADAEGKIRPEQAVFTDISRHFRGAGRGNEQTRLGASHGRGVGLFVIEQSAGNDGIENVRVRPLVDAHGSSSFRKTSKLPEALNTQQASFSETIKAPCILEL